MLMAYANQEQPNEPTNEKKEPSGRISMNATMMGEDLKQYRWAYRKGGSLHFAGLAPKQEW
jgi:hypothetical protein